MATSKDVEKVTPVVITKIPPILLSTRQQFLFLLGPSLVPEAGTGNTHWEQLECVGFNPELSTLEATLSIKLASGYSGGLCTAGSTEYVRFFIDWEDGAGYVDAGVSSVQVHDIPDGAPAQHPLRYLVQHELDAESHRRRCTTAVLPKVRAVLSWNSVPSTNANDLPVFGNRVDTRIQIKPRLGFDVATAVASGIFSAELLTALSPSTFVKFKPQPVALEQLAVEYKRAKVEDHRLAFGVLHPLLAKTGTSLAKVSMPAQLASLSKLKIDINSILKALDASKANVDYEELTCVGLSPSQDTLGAIVRMKRSAGYSGNLCSTGSQEYVAFWADWNNDGTFEEYLGTTSVEVHDYSHDDPIDYAVQFPTAAILNHLRTCANPNIIRIRAVLSWSSLPSTTDPDDLNTWGNRVDALVQLRTGHVVGTDIISELYDIGSIAIDAIDPATNLALPGVGAGAYRPWGGAIRIGGRIYNTGAPGNVHYRVDFQKDGTSGWTPVADHATFELMHPLPWDPLYPKQTVTVPAVNGWFPYREDPTSSPPIFERTALLAVWSSGTAQGTYRIRLQYTTDDPSVVASPTVLGTEMKTIVVNNIGFTVNPLPTPEIDSSYSVDIVIRGGDCKLYPQGVNLNTKIDGRVRVHHEFFGSYSLDLQPSTHTHGVQPTLAGTGTNARSVTSLADDGDAAAPWTINTNPPAIDSCGYTVMLYAHDRTIVNSNTAITFSAAKAVGFAVF